MAPPVRFIRRKFPVKQHIPPGPYRVPDAKEEVKFRVEELEEIIARWERIDCSSTVVMP
jgi:hypothetical protein